jgi:hypothetical protein
MKLSGGGPTAVTLFVVSALCWGTAIALGILGSWSQYRAAAEASSVTSNKDRKASRVMWFGIILGLMPGPWMLLLKSLAGGPEITKSSIAVVPSLIFLCLGCVAIIYRNLVAMKIWFGRRPDQ